MRQIIANTLLTVVLTAGLVFFFALVAAGCGGDYLLDEGMYEVSGTMLTSTDPLSNNFESEWFIQYRNDGRYRLVMNEATHLFGADSNGRALFSLHDNISSNDDCPFWAMLEADLTPTDKGFEGNVFSGYTYCTFYNPNTEEIQLQDNNTEYFVVGELK